MKVLVKTSKLLSLGHLFIRYESATLLMPFAVVRFSSGMCEAAVNIFSLNPCSGLVIPLF